MRSAYQILGVPGNASQQEIDDAYANAQKLFTPERIAAGGTDFGRFTELKQAYQVLRDPESRAAHDRKLASAAPAVRARAKEAEPPPRERVALSMPRPEGPALWIGAAVVLLLGMGAFGYYVNARNVETRRLIEAQEQAARLEAEQEAQRKQQEAERAAAQAARDKARAEAQDRQLSMQTQMSASRVAAEVRRDEYAAQRAEREQEYRTRMAEQQRRQDEYQAAREAERRIAEDKRRVRELCMLNYRRPDC